MKTGDLVDANDNTVKEVNAVSPMNEAETRAELIDPVLKAAGWGVVEGTRIWREKNCEIVPGRLVGKGKRGKPLIADYILEYRNTKLAVVEAKAVTEAVTEGVGQAKLYAGKLGVRFTYATNGKGIYAIDMHTGAEGDVDAQARETSARRTAHGGFINPTTTRTAGCAIRQSCAWVSASHLLPRGRRTFLAAPKCRPLLTRWLLFRRRFLRR